MLNQQNKSMDGWLGYFLLGNLFDGWLGNLFEVNLNTDELNVSELNDFIFMVNSFAVNLKIEELNVSELNFFFLR